MSCWNPRTMQMTDMIGIDEILRCASEEQVKDIPPPCRTPGDYAHWMEIVAEEVSKATQTAYGDELTDKVGGLMAVVSAVYSIITDETGHRRFGPQLAYEGILARVGSVISTDCAYALAQYAELRAEDEPREKATDPFVWIGDLRAPR